MTGIAAGSDITLGPDHDPAKETLTDNHCHPITTDYLKQLAEEAEAGFDLAHTHPRTARELAAMRIRRRPTPTTSRTGQSRAVSVRMNPEPLTELHAAHAPSAEHLHAFRTLLIDAGGARSGVSDKRWIRLGI